MRCRGKKDKRWLGRKRTENMDEEEEINGEEMKEEEEKQRKKKKKEEKEEAQAAREKIHIKVFYSASHNKKQLHNFDTDRKFHLPTCCAASTNMNTAHKCASRVFTNMWPLKGNRNTDKP